MVMKSVGHVGGNLNNGANAGLSYLNRNSASSRNWNIGAHVRTYFSLISFTVPLGKIHNKRSNWVSNC